MPWPEETAQGKSPLVWVKAAEIPPGVEVHPRCELPANFPGRDDLLDFIANLENDPETTYLPGMLEVKASQSPYQRHFELTLSDWKAKPQESSPIALMSADIASVEGGPAPTQPIVADDQLIRINQVALGMTAQEYRAIAPVPEGVRFRADNDTVVFVTGNELEYKPGGAKVSAGQPEQDAIDLLAAAGLSLEDQPGALVFTNDRMQVYVLRSEGRIEDFAIWGNLPEGGEAVVDPHDPDLTIYSLRPGCSEAELLAVAGHPESETVEEGRRVLRWGVWPHQPGEIPGVRLEGVIRDGRVERLRGDRIDQGGRVLLSWGTPLPPGWDTRKMAAALGPETLRDYLRRLKYFRVTYQEPDIDRAPHRKGPERILEFTDRGLSIWEYPQERRQFQLVFAEPPSLGIDLEYP